MSSDFLGCATRPPARPDIAIMRAAARAMPALNAPDMGCYDHGRIAVIGLQGQTLAGCEAADRPRARLWYRGATSGRIQIAQALQTASWPETDGISRLLAKLPGAFALAIADPAADVLYLATDALGAQPLYYTEAPPCWFSTQLAALLRHPDVPFGIHSAALDAYLALGYVPGDRTLMTAICKVPAGHVLKIDLATGRRTQHRYWHLTEPSSYDHPDYPDLETSVRSRLTAVVRDACDQSAAILLDDTVAAAALVGAADATMPTVSIGVGPAAGPFVTALARARRGHHTHVPVQLDALWPALSAWAARLHEPIADPWVLHRQLLQPVLADTSTLLTPAGGDACFAAAAHHVAAADPPDWRAVLGVVLRQNLGIDAPSGWDAAASRPGGGPWLCAPETRAGLLRSRQTFAQTAWYASFYRQLASFGSSLRRACLADLQLVVPGTLIAQAGSHDAPRLVAPFLHPDLLAYALGLPDSAKVQEGRGARLLAQAFAPILPVRLPTHPPMPGSMLLRRWFAQGGTELLQSCCAFQEDAVCLDGDALLTAVRQSLAHGRHDRWLFGVLAYKTWLMAAYRVEKYYPDSAPEIRTGLHVNLGQGLAPQVEASGLQ